MPLEDKDPDLLLERAYNLQSMKESKALYRDWATTYDETMLDRLGYLTPQKTAELLSSVVEDRDSKILDVGSGTGLAGVELNKLGFTNIDALDYSAEMLRVASERNIYVDLFEMDLTKALSLSNESYDAMICTGTFTHAHVGAECLDELFRLLKPGGMFTCTVHKDCWIPQGFQTKVNELESSGSICTYHHEAGTYFESDTKPEGWFIVWEKCA